MSIAGVNTRSWGTTIDNMRAQNASVEAIIGYMRAENFSSEAILDYLRTENARGTDVYRNNMRSTAVSRINACCVEIMEKSVMPSVYQGNESIATALETIRRALIVLRDSTLYDQTADNLAAALQSYSKSITENKETDKMNSDLGDRINQLAPQFLAVAQDTAAERARVVQILNSENSFQRRDHWQYHNIPDYVEEVDHNNTPSPSFQGGIPETPSDFNTPSPFSQP